MKAYTLVWRRVLRRAVSIALKDTNFCAGVKTLLSMQMQGILRGVHFDLRFYLHIHLEEGSTLGGAYRSEEVYLGSGKLLYYKHHIHCLTQNIT